jgi:hypothetical protein
MKIGDFDRFGEEGMSKEEYAKKQDYVLSKCKCPGCPTFVKGDNPAGAYCFPLVGTSKAIQWEKNCVCATCPIYKEYELEHTFYCTRCSQLCQTYKKEIGSGHE